MQIQLWIRIFISMRIPIRLFHFDADSDQDSKDDAGNADPDPAILDKVSSFIVKIGIRI
jgi:hypothetical protein